MFAVKPLQQYLENINHFTYLQIPSSLLWFRTRSFCEFFICQSSAHWHCQVNVWNFTSYETINAMIAVNSLPANRVVHLRVRSSRTSFRKGDGDILVEFRFNINYCFP